MEQQILEVRHLSVEFPVYQKTVHAVRDVSFSVASGECLAIVGESGCGKSVTARAIMGLTSYAGGQVGADSEILYRGENILAFSEREWARFRGRACSIIFQDSMSCLNPTIKIGQQITESLYLHRKLRGGAAEAEAIRLLRMVGIQDAPRRFHSYPHELSGGMRQRVMIAAALACNPDILIADEPTTALDVTTQAQILKLLQDIQQELHMAIIIITHDLGIVANIADRIMVMYGGKVGEIGTAEDIFFRNCHPYTSALLDAVPRLDLDCGQKLRSFEGAPPALYDPPPGCAFAPRCGACMNVCLKHAPEMFPVGELHQVSCWKYHPLCPGAGREDT